MSTAYYQTQHAYSSMHNTIAAKSPCYTGPFSPPPYLQSPHSPIYDRLHRDNSTRYAQQHAARPQQSSQLVRPQIQRPGTKSPRSLDTSSSTTCVSGPHLSLSTITSFSPSSCLQVLINNLIIDMHIIQPIFHAQDDSINFSDNTYFSHMSLYEFLKSTRLTEGQAIKVSSAIDCAIRNYLIFLTSLNLEREVFATFPESMHYAIRNFVANLQRLLDVVLSSAVHANYDVSYSLV